MEGWLALLDLALLTGFNLRKRFLASFFVAHYEVAPRDVARGAVSIFALIPPVSCEPRRIRHLSKTPPPSP